MDRLFVRLQAMEQKIFIWINGRLHNRFLNFWLYYLTHLGGATFTITASLFIGFIAPEPWGSAGYMAFTALAISHIPVAAAKKLYPRIRPYLAMPETNTFRNPLSDHSFPSGHTTAIFSVTMPFMFTFPEVTILLLPVACIVGFSRIYLGLHYPSDVLAGAIIGTSVAFGTVALWP
ncbi:phosphatase PAP2 family protein [Paenibacillus shunpengii]|uniref:Phosphatase PAP2 family protein n=1 Tax=Paenibacillus shunpengii TaxID=2054424 RepID=A0ABW5SIY7_9BACL|nr:MULTISPECIES: phosphatase PAP2 family protein [unclassified Paenibacillus]OMC71616.1 phosphatase PAP2 family protein [Paenibacillus sp. FSL H7-0326]SDW32547.1 undecaprenyl-diphosphatase [Paenibacillus sp. PDC88]